MSRHNQRFRSLQRSKFLSSKTSSRRLSKMSSRRLANTSSKYFARRPEDVLKTFWKTKKWRRNFYLVTSYQLLLVTSYQSLVASYQSLVTSYQSLVVSHQLIVTSHQSLVTSHGLPANTSHQFLSNISRQNDICQGYSREMFGSVFYLLMFIIF